MKTRITWNVVGILWGLLALLPASGLCQTDGNCGPVSADEARPWLNASYTPACRAVFVLRQLHTLDDKLSFLVSSSGQQMPPGYRDLVTELGLKRGGLSDGPAGVRGVKSVTAFPTPLTLAASFDPSVATRYGHLLGEEFFAAGLNQDFGPATDIARTWHFGRVTESFGEDPLLAASMIAPEIAAMQTHHVIATVKHFAAYSQEQGRAGDQPVGERPAVNEDVSERALREIYFPAFRAAIVQGKAGEVMCSFPRINGVYACENAHTLGILKQEWGFDGVVGPDYPDAQRSIVPSFIAGLDTGVIAPLPPSGFLPTFAGQKSVKQAVEGGLLPMPRLDDMILRRLTAAFRIGVYDHPARLVEGEISTPARRAAAAEIVASGAVLLKNSGLLPLNPGFRKIAIIGAQATDLAVVVEQGSPRVPPDHLVSVLSAMRARAGTNFQIVYSQGTLGLAPLTIMPGTRLRTPSGEPGVLAEYFANPRRDFSGSPLARRIESTLALDEPPAVAGLPENLQWSARFTTLFTPERSGMHHFTLDGTSSARLYIDGKLIGEFLRSDMETPVYANVALTAGKPVEIRVEFAPRAAFLTRKTSLMGFVFGPFVELGWAPPHDLREQAVEVARKADVAIVVVGHQVGEGMDRLSLALPNDQNALIDAVAQANPHTVVVLNTGGAVTMPWLDKVQAVLETWLPGDADGPATSALLFGDTEPGGRLPITFPADESQGPATLPAQYPGTEYNDGALDTVHFDEGIFVGYRYWSQYHQQPLFPFGFGLSYTTFSIQAGAVHPDGKGGAVADVSVANTGKRAGSEVVQAYLGFPASAGEPPRQLKAFAKVYLLPAEEKTVHLTLPQEAFQYWDEPANQWVKAAGDYTLMIGTSSDKIVWQGAIHP